jgi:hypothetical protein
VQKKAQVLFIGSALRGIIILVCAGACYAQAQPPLALGQSAPAQSPAGQARPSPAAASGLEPAWVIAPVLQEMGEHAARLLPILDSVDVKSWIAKGASETYAEQLQSSKDQAKALADGSRALARNPERLSASLELFFRIAGLETMLSSLEEGIRKYQGQQVAQQLASLEAENGANRERFRAYIVNLAAQREQQFEVMDREAQRCRSTLTQPAPSSASRRKK